MENSAVREATAAIEIRRRVGFMADAAKAVLVKKSLLVPQNDEMMK